MNKHRKSLGMTTTAASGFQLVVGDPAWRYSFSKSRSRRVERHYPTMTVREICEIPVPQIVANDAVLLLWSTAPKLKQAFEVMEAWGFEYKTFDVWRKLGRKGMGYYWRCRHEPILLGTRGHPGCPVPKDRPDSCFDARVGKHSAKPDEAMERIERMFPHLSRRIELFAREHRPGWVSWGHDVTGSRGLVEVAHDAFSRRTGESFERSSAVLDLEPLLPRAGVAALASGS